MSEMPLFFVAVLLFLILDETSEIHLVTGQTLECRYFELTDREIVCRTRGGGEIRLPLETIRRFGRRGLCNS